MTSWFAERARLGTAVLGCSIVFGGALTLSAQGAEESRARNQLELAKQSMKQGKSEAALRDLAEIVTNYPATLVADDALLEQAKYRIDNREPEAATALVEKLRKAYPGADTYAMSYVIEGRAALLLGRDPKHISSAIENFERAATIDKEFAPLAEAMYRAGSAARIGANYADAVRRFSELSMRFPTAEWTSNALLESALALVRVGGSPARPMEQLQRVRNAFPESRAAGTAHEWNTLLYRLYLRAPGLPAYQRDEGNVGAKLRDVVGLAVNAKGDALVVTKAGVTTYPAQGTAQPLVVAPEPLSVFFDRDGRAITVHETTLRNSQGTPVALEMPLDGDHPMKLKIRDAVMTASGEYLIADGNQDTILRFTATGKPAVPLAKTAARRMVITDLDEVVVLDDKTVTVFARDGKVAAVIRERGQGEQTYRLQDPSDVAVDVFGHIYILDKSSILVFTTDGRKLLTTFALPARVEARYLAVSPAGRLHVFDARTDTVQIYR